MSLQPCQRGSFSCIGFQILTCDNHQCDEDMPLLDFIITVWRTMIQEIHLNHEFSHDVDDRSQIEKPAEEVNLRMLSVIRVVQ